MTGTASQPKKSGVQDFQRVLTAKLSQPLHICLDHQLRVLEARAEGRDVDTLQRSFEGIEHDAVRAIADRVDVLRENQSMN